MSCPLCGGPLHLENPEQFVCERGHAMSGAEFRLAASTRVSTALWMAIEALDTEALALRALAARADPDGSLLEAADQAERDASLLRGLADGHVPTTAGAEP